MTTRKKVESEPAAEPLTSTVDPEQQLDGFIAKFDPKSQKLIRAVRKAIRKRFATAHEMVWDNYNFFVLGYSPTPRPSDAVVSIAADANGIALCFIHGANLSDPANLLSGSGKQTRFVRVPTAATITLPDVEALIADAVARSRVPFPATGRGTLVIRSVSAKQRPRRNERI